MYPETCTPTPSWVDMASLRGLQRSGEQVASDPERSTPHSNRIRPHRYIRRLEGDGGDTGERASKAKVASRPLRDPEKGSRTV